MTVKVLSIEDQPDIRRLIRMTLEFDGMDVVEACDGAEGLAMARHHKPDVILMDVMMPNMDGLTACDRLNQDPELRDIPVVMISALGRPNDIDAGMSHGARAYLIKPFSPWELLNLIGKLTNHDTTSAAPQPNYAPGTTQTHLAKGDA